MEPDVEAFEEEIVYSEFEPTPTQGLEDELNLTSEPEETK
jgi:hypothetical protein